MLITNNFTFQPKYTGKLFEVKPATINSELEVEAEATTPEGQALQKLVQDGWKKELDSLKAKYEDEYGKAIVETEKRVYKSAYDKRKQFHTEAAWINWLNEEAKGANVMIVNAIKTFESIVQTKLQEFYNKASQAIDKKFNTTLRNKKVKAAFKILGHIAIIVVAAAVAIVATALGVAVTAMTMGAGAPLLLASAAAVVGSVVTIGKSLKAIGDAYATEWPNCKKAIDTLKKKLGEYSEAIDYENRKKDKKELTGKLGPKESLKLLFNNVKGKRSGVEDAIKQAEMYHGHMMSRIEGLAKEMNKIVQDTEKVGANAGTDKEVEKCVKEMNAKIGLMQHKINKKREFIKQLDEAITASKDAIAEKNFENGGVLKGAIGKVQNVLNNDSVQALISESGPLVTAISALKTALEKFIKIMG